MDERLRPSQPSWWILLGLAAVFLGIAVLFVALPSRGAAVYGIPLDGAASAAYVRAIGFRDLALALYLGGLTLFAGRRALALVLGFTVVIPLGDLALLLAVFGRPSPGHLLLHGMSALIFAALAVSVGRGGKLRH